MAWMECDVSSNQSIRMVTDDCNSKQYRIAHRLSSIDFGIIEQLAIVWCCANANFIIASIETVMVKLIWFRTHPHIRSSGATKFQWPQVSFIYSLHSKMQTVRLKEKQSVVVECEWCLNEWKWRKRRTQKPINHLHLFHWTEKKKIEQKLHCINVEEY